MSLTDTESESENRPLTHVYEWLDLHKSELQSNWDRIENGETLVRITPLG